MAHVATIPSVYVVRRNGGSSSNDDDDHDGGPRELPNGRLVCSPHGLVQCGICCTDYSFMDDVLSEDGEDELGDDDGDLPLMTLMTHSPGAVRGTGRVFPSRFSPRDRDARPTELFYGRFRYMNVVRYAWVSSSPCH